MALRLPGFVGIAVPGEVTREPSTQPSGRDRLGKKGETGTLRSALQVTAAEGSGGGGQIQRRRKRRPGQGRRVHCKPQGGEASRRLASPGFAAGASERSAFCSNGKRSMRWAAFFSWRGRVALACTALHSSVRNSGSGRAGGVWRRKPTLLTSPFVFPHTPDPRSQPVPAVQSSFPK